MAYWLSDKFTSTFSENASFNELFVAKQGLATGNNDRFVRFWHEPAWCKTDCTQTLSDDFSSTRKWFPYSKGGEARKWYGNHDLLINWENNGEPLKEFKDGDGNRLSTLKNLAFMFRPAITWSLTSISGILCTRFRPNGFVFDTNGMSAFSLSEEVTEEFGVALLNSRFAQETLKVLNPTMAFQSGDIDRVPVPRDVKNLREKTPASALVRIAKSDWDAYETSWDFTSLVALDQPTVVPNAAGSRPVDKVAASLVSFVGGGVQPANRSKIGMFCDASPIWSFISGLDATEDPIQARTASAGHFLIEVFPALALPALDDGFSQRLCAPKYNPQNRKKFRLEDWQAVARVVERSAERFNVPGLAEWAHQMRNAAQPRKSDQDKLDAAICALIGLYWRAGPTAHSAFLGDVVHGYMVTPISDATWPRLQQAAIRRGVPTSQDVGS